MQKRTKYIFLLTLVCGVITFSLINKQLISYSKKPSHKDWSALHSEIYLYSEPYDALVFEPQWLVGYATDFNKFQFLDLLRVKNAVLDEQDAPYRIWFISLDDNYEMHDLFKRYKVIKKFKRKNVFVYLFERSDESVVFRFDEQLMTASAKIESSGGVEHAVPEGSTFVFRSNDLDWNKINVESSVFAFNQKRRRAIRFHPVKSSKKSLSYKNLPKCDTMYVTVFLADSGRKYDLLDSVLFSVFSGEEKLFETKIDEQNAEHSVRLPCIDNPDNSVSFTVSPLQDSVTKRHIFFSAFTTRKK